jgi:hypothetical protein
MDQLTRPQRVDDAILELRRRRRKCPKIAKFL